MRTLEELRNALVACHDNVCGQAMIAEETMRTDAFVSMHDREGRYIEVSQSITALLGYLPNDLIGKSAYDFIHPDDFEEVLRSHVRITVQAGTSSVTYRIRAKDGTYHRLTSLSKPIVQLEHGLQEILVLTF